MSNGFLESANRNSGSSLLQKWFVPGDLERPAREALTAEKGTAGGAAEGSFLALARLGEATANYFKFQATAPRRIQFQPVLLSGVRKKVRAASTS